MGYNFEELFYHEYFSLPSQRRDLARELEETERSRTLFLLDGLDEVSRDWSGEDDMFRFLKELLDQPNAIITSRPYGLPPDLLQIHRPRIGNDRVLPRSSKRVSPKDLIRSAKDQKDSVLPSAASADPRSCSNSDSAGCTLPHLERRLRFQDEA